MSVCGREVVSNSLQLHGVIQDPLGYLHLAKNVSSCYIFRSETQIQRAFLSTGPSQGSVAAVAGAKQHKLHLPCPSPATGAIPGSISLASANLAQIELELPLGSVSRSKGCPWIVFPSLVLQGISGVWG